MIDGEMKDFLRRKFGVDNVENLDEARWNEIQDKCEEMILDEVKDGELTPDGEMLDDILGISFGEILK